MAFHAALANQLQRAVNVCHGSARHSPPSASNSGGTRRRTYPGQKMHLGLDRLDVALLALTLFLSALTFGGARTNVLQGTVHLLLFVVYIALIFSL
jgi:Ca2+:H+ antiporter